MTGRAGALALLLALASIRTSAAQCPDGSPPPCGHAQPLDDNRWIIVPFQNISRAPDAEWLGGASVNLLYLNLSQWRELRVVDDGRVADLLRARGGASLGLADAIALARRVRAGKVVTGDLLKVGASLTVIGKVYRTSDGQRLRQVSVDVPSPDSVFSSYRRLASLLLDVPPADARGSIGTTSLDAYRDYLRGVAHLQSWALDSARSAFNQAIAADSAFALAHYQLARTLGWIGAGTRDETREATTATRLAAGLPERQRALLSAYVDFLLGRLDASASAYRALIAHDSSDAEAWYSLGETEFHNPLVVPVRGTMTFAGSWNSALADFQRTLALDPAYHLAYAHIADIYGATERYGCDRTRPGSYGCDSRDYVGWPRLQADTIVILPRGAATSDSTVLADMLAAGASGIAAHGRRALRDAAERWVLAGPREADAHIAFAEALLRLGDAEGAARELTGVTGGSRLREPSELLRLRAEIALKRGRYDEAHAIADTLFALPLPPYGDPANGLYALLGNFRRWDERTAPGWPPAFKAAFDATARTVAGAPPPNLDDAEQGFLQFQAGQDTMFHPDRAMDRLSALLMTTAFGLNRPRERLPFDTSAAGTPFMRLVSARVRRNADAIRRFAIALEQAPENTAAPPGTTLLLLAESWVEIGDTARARAALVRLEDEVYRTSPLDGGGFSRYSGDPGMWGRAFLLQGDLASAQGDRAVAARAYQRVIGLWSGADAELQPFVARARTGLAASGVSR